MFISAHLGYQSLSDPGQFVRSPQLGPGAYSGIFRMPTTDIVPEGELAFGFAGGASAKQLRIDSRTNRRSNVYSGVMGYLPRLEVGLSFLTPSLLNGIVEDRSVAAKFAPFRPGTLPFSLAIGSTDLQGTRRRATDYVVLGRRLGSLSLFAGTGRGFYEGAFGGATLRLSPEIDLAAERFGGVSLLGARLYTRAKWSGGIGVDQNGAAFASLTHAISLRTAAGPKTPSLSGGLEDLARAVASVGRGAARIDLQGDTLVASYEDVEVRNPLRTLGLVLRMCSEAAPRGTESVTVTVRRFNHALVTVSGPRSTILSYCQGFLSEESFLEEVAISDGGVQESSGEVIESATAGDSPKVLITATPTLNYRLGLRDVLPNKEAIRFTGVTALPASLIATATVVANVNNSLDRRAAVASPAFGLYRVDRLPTGTWTFLGLDRTEDEMPAATIRVSQFFNPMPIRISGTMSKPIDRSGGSATSYSAEGALQLMKGDLELWGRTERFAAGDKGVTIGITRRFGQTWVNLFSLRSSDAGNTVHRVGIDLQFPLPSMGTQIGPIRLVSSPIADFIYQPTLHALAAFGRGERRSTVFSPDGDLTARSQLTAGFIRQQVRQLVSP